MRYKKVTLSRLLLLAFTLLASNLDCYSQNSSNTSPAMGVIKRLIGDRAKEFDLKLVPVNKDHKADYFKIEVTEKKVQISGSSNTILCYGAYTYLKDIGAALVSWEGNRVALPAKWPAYTKEATTDFKFRKYMNACTFGYTTPWWDWKRWEQEIDWMALHGINMPTALEGQEAIWQMLWKEYGMTDDEIRNHFTGPAFLPWQRMGNINSLDGALPQNWIEKKKDVQTKILARMRSLDMHPVVPAFSGYVPKVIANKYAKSKIAELNGWSGGGFDSTFLLDPKDPLFKEFGKRFIALYEKVYGKSDYFLADSFNEITPPVQEETKYDELADYGKAIYETINDVSPNGTWVMQGWLFGDNKEFWTKQATSAFLSKVPNDRIIIQDYANDRYKVWETQEAFYGKQWSYGYVHNYGGSNPVYGDLNFYRDELRSLLKNSNKGNLLGYGVMPEGLNTNSIVYEYLYDLPWTKGEETVETWLEKYLTARYGHENRTSAVTSSWHMLLNSVYNIKYWETRWWEDRAGAYLFFKTPTIDILKFKGNPGNKALLKEAIDKMKTESKALKSSNLLAYDLADATRHYNSLCLDDLLIECVQAFENNDIASADVLYKKIEKLALATDRVVSSQPLNNLSVWLQEAKNYGTNKIESDLYIQNAKALITKWGGSGHLNDYASRSWGGMYTEFYWPRWKMFLTKLRESKVKGQVFDEQLQQNSIKKWEKDWCAQVLF